MYTARHRPESDTNARVCGCLHGSVSKSSSIVVGSRGAVAEAMRCNAQPVRWRCWRLYGSTKRCVCVPLAREAAAMASRHPPRSGSANPPCVFSASRPSCRTTTWQPARCSGRTSRCFRAGLDSKTLKTARWLTLSVRCECAVNRARRACDDAGSSEPWQPGQFPLPRGMKSYTRFYVTPFKHVVYSTTWYVPASTARGRWRRIDDAHRYSLAVAGTIMTFIKFRRGGR